MSEPPDFLTVDDVLLIHGESLARYGGGSGIRDPRALESAVATPQAGFALAERRLDKAGLTELLRSLARGAAGAAGP